MDFDHERSGDAERVSEIEAVEGFEESDCGHCPETHYKTEKHVVEEYAL